MSPLPHGPRGFDAQQAYGRLSTVIDYCTETLSDEEWIRNTGLDPAKDCDPKVVEGMRTVCSEVLRIAKGEAI